MGLCGNFTVSFSDEAVWLVLWHDMFSYFIDEFFALFKRVLCICEGFYFTNENLNIMSLDEWGSGLWMKDGQTSNCIWMYAIIFSWAWQYLSQYWLTGDNKCCLIHICWCWNGLIYNGTRTKWSLISNSNKTEWSPIMSD